MQVGLIITAVIPRLQFQPPRFFSSFSSQLLSGFVPRPDSFGRIFIQKKHAETTKPALWRAMINIYYINIYILNLDGPSLNHFPVSASTTIQKWPLRILLPPSEYYSQCYHQYASINCNFGCLYFYIFICQMSNKKTQHSAHNKPYSQWFPPVDKKHLKIGGCQVEYIIIIVTITRKGYESCIWDVGCLPRHICNISMIFCWSSLSHPRTWVTPQ